MLIAMLLFTYMDRKKLVMICMVIGSYAGGYIPSLWGQGAFTFWGVLFTAIGGFAGIYLGFKMSD